MPTDPSSSSSRRGFLLAAGIAAFAPSLARAAAAPATGAALGEIDVRSCGAVGNGRVLDTVAINSAIKRVSASGGGTVRIPAGDYLCHTLHLQDNVTLHLDRGATLHAGPAGLYDATEPNPWEQYQDYGHDHWRNSLIYGEGVKNVTITGPGVICGDGLARADDGPVPHSPTPHGKSSGQGHDADKIIALKNCRDVALDGFSLVGSPHIAILATGVTGLRVSRLMVDVIRDGIDIDCCEDVVVEDSAFNTPHDDSIVLKSSDALGERRPTRNVTIRRCFVTGGFRHGTLFDGRRIAISAADGMKARIKIGTESCWGFENIAVESCVVWNALGIPLLTVDGGGLKNVVLRDIAMRDIQDAPLFMRLGSRLRAPDGASVQDFAGITVDTLNVDGFRMPLTISGIPDHRIANVVLRNIALVQRPMSSGGADNGGWMPLAAALTAGDTMPPENANAYPEAGMFGPLPAKLFFARHVDGLTIDGLRLKLADTAHAMPATTQAVPVDRRPMFWLSDVRESRFSRIDVPHDAAQKLCVSDSACSLATAISAPARPG